MLIENRRASRRENFRLFLGCCIDCGEPREGEGATSTRCPAHAEKVRLTALKRRERLIREGLCVRCQGSRGEGSGRTVCAACREVVRRESLAYSRRRRSRGLCYSCGRPAGRFSLCLRHREAQSRRRRAERACSQ